MADATPTLLYFPVRARAESIRMLAAYVGFQLAEEIIDMPGSDQWRKLKPTTPEGTLPLLRLANDNLKVTSEELGRSDLMATYIAENAAGRTVDTSDEQKQLFKETTVRPLDRPNLFLNVWRISHVESLIPPWLESITAKIRLLENRLLGSTGAFFGGESPGLADFGLFHFKETLDVLLTFYGMKFPFDSKWEEWQNAFRRLDGIQDYLNNRPKSGMKTLGHPGTIIYERKIKDN